MKILHVTDTHGTAKNPAGRKDIFYITVFKKFMELGAIIKRENIDLVIHTGDLFHTPRVSLKFAGKISELINAWEVPVYVVPGNHDLDGYNINTIDQTMLGFMAKNKTVRLLTRGDFVTKSIIGMSGNKYELTIEGQEYYDDIDTNKNDDYNMTIASNDFHILGIHSMLLDKPYFPDIPHTLIKDVQTNADIILSGHYHPGYKEVYQNGTWFFNPGSSLRIEATKFNMNNIPKVLILNIDENSTQNGVELISSKYIPFSVAQPGKDIFDFVLKQKQDTKKKSLINFKQSVQQACSMHNTNSISNIIKTIASLTNTDKEITDIAMRYMNDAKINDKNKLPEIKGFIEKKDDIWITKLVIHNFQSHKDTTVSFMKGFNVISGESNKGKTAIIRALVWCLFNDPKGADFITTGENECFVQTFFSDSSNIKRSRTLKSAGKYTVTDSNGNSMDFSGFNNDIPIQVFNTHQMPEVYISKDIKTRLNISTQLDSAFLLSESSQIKAAAVGRIIGTQIVDNAIKNLNKDILNCNKTVKGIDKQIAEWNKELEAYNDLDDMKHYIDMFQILLDMYDKYNRETKECKLIKQNIDNCRKQILDTTNAINALPNLDLIISNIERGIDRNNELIHLYSLYKEHVNIKNSISNNIKAIDKIPKEKTVSDVITDMENRINEAESIYSIRNGRVAIYQKIEVLKNTMPNQGVVKIIPVIKNKITAVEELTNMCNLLKQLDNVNTTKISINNKRSNLNNAIDKIENLSKSCKSKIIGMVGDTCPFCGKKIDNLNVEHILS